MKFEITGTFRIGDGRQNFTKLVEAESEKLAQLKVLSKLGSDHKVKRRDIEIKAVTKEITKEVKANVEKESKQG